MPSTNRKASFPRAKRCNSTPANTTGCFAALSAAAAAETVTVPVREGRGVRGLVPQYLQLTDRASFSPDEIWPITFRPDDVYRGGVVLIRADGKLIQRRKTRIMTPGEMVVERLKAADLPAGPIRELTVEVEGVPQHA